MVVFHFDHDCVGANLAEREVQFLDKEKNLVQASYDLLVGADGISSAIRRATEKQIGGFMTYKKESTRFYVSFSVDKIPERKIPTNYKKVLEPGIITLSPKLQPSNGSKGLDAMFFASFGSGKVIGTTSGSEVGFATIEGREREYLNDVMPDDFPQEWKEQMAVQLRNTPKRKVPSILEVSTLVGPSVALLGDASHAVGPRLGTGCNMAVQDSRALCSALEAAEGDLDQALKTYNDVRHKEVRQTQFLVKLASSISTKNEGVSKLLPILRWMHYTFHAQGNKYLPWLIQMSPILRFERGAIHPGSAVQILKLEFASLLIATAVIILGSFKAVASLL